MINSKLPIVVLLILIIISSLMAGCSNEFPQNEPEAENGMLNLTKWQFENKVARLDGEWEFYYNKLLNPGEIKETGTQRTGYINIPGSWNQYIINDRELSGEGYATYRLLFVTDENGRLGIKIPRIFTSYKLWVNEELVASAGTTGKSRETMVAQYLPQVALFEPRQGENEIIIQVSNFYHRSGGILESLVIGSEKQIIKLHNKSIAYELFLFGCLAIIGMYHLALFIFRKKNTAALYFGMFCLFVGIRTLLVGERFLIYMFPSFNWEIAHKIQTLTFYLGVPLILMFFISFFPKYFHLKIVRIVQLVGISFGILVVFTPAKTFTAFNPIYQVFTFVVIVYTICTFIKMIVHKEKGTELIIVGALALVLTSLNDIVFLSIWMNDISAPFLRTLFRTGNLSSAGQLVFVSTSSLMLAKKFSGALEHEEVVTAQLKEINMNLDKLVTERTEALKESVEKIEFQKLELEKANQALHLLSLKDPLTDLWNRRHYDAVIKTEWNRSLRHNSPISLMILDIDYFKAYNDYYGHMAGDECLERVAHKIRKLFRRAGDLVVRYGGEEFAVIMYGLAKDEAVQISLLIQKAIEELNIPHNRSLVSSRVTVSIGVTSVVPDINSSPVELFLTADKALYQAKAAGRNQVKFIPL